ncbi:glycosyltransferase [Patescibacteria group bacterium]|nr:glycosyltransferase [Patescibacteria group bacterium]
MKISIITSVYNNKETVADAIESVLGQSYSNIEYIVVDGNSSDGTIELVKSYGNNITQFVSEPDKGIYDGLNKGVRLATGDVVGFLHSDDLYAAKDIIELVAKEFTQNDVDGVYGDLVYTPKNDTSKVLRYWKSKIFEIALLKKGWMPAHPTLFLKRDVYEKFGGFDLDFKIAGDYDFMLRVLNGGIKVKYIPQVLYKMRVGGESNKSIKNIMLKSREDLKALKKNNVGGVYSLLLKNLSKITQFIKKEN